MIDLEAADLPSCQVGQIVNLVIDFLDEDGIPLDMSEAQNMKIRIELPDGTSSDTTDVNFLNDGFDGAVFHQTSADDLAQSGFVHLQGFATLNGVDIKTDVGTLYVKPDAHAPGDVVVTPPVYVGNPSTDGSWRLFQDGNNLVAQRRENGVWVTKDTFTP